jgi:hypothetical protein
VHLLGNRRLDTSLLGDETFEQVFTLLSEELPILPWVDTDTQSGRDAALARKDDLILQDLRELDARHGLGRHDILLLNSFRSSGLTGIVDWLEELGPDRAPMVSLVLHYTAHPYPNEPSPSREDYRAAFSRFQGSAVSGRLFVFTDSDELAAEYRAIHPIDVRVLPIPHCLPPASLIEPVRERPLRFAYAGEARRNKGFHLLPHAVGTLQNVIGAAQVHFAIQAYSSDHGDEAVGAALAEMPEGVTLYTQPLDEEAYEGFLAAADVIVIPYLRANYHAQTSGIYAEAVSLAKPVIVPSHTWMASQVERFGGGLIFDAEQGADFTAKCLEMLQQYARLHNEAIAASTKWCEFHNSSTFIDMVLNAASPGR